MSLSKEELKTLRDLYKKIQNLPAFEGVVIRRMPLKDAHGYAGVRSDGSRYIYISNELSFSDTVDTLAHECAHLLVDLDDSHNEIFNIVYAAMVKVLCILLYA